MYNPTSSQLLGIDVGGSGIKAALVDVDDARLVGGRHRIDTPQPSTPENIAEVVAQLVEHFAYSGTVGCSFPAVIISGRARTAGNIDKSWR